MAWVLFICVVCIIAIVFLSGHSPFKSRTRGDFLQALAEFLDGRLKPMEDLTDSFSIEFTFQGQPFVYEDVPEKGFNEQGYKAYLKTQSGSKLTVSFTEKPRSMSIRSEVIIASQIPDEPVSREEKVRVPERLKGLNVHTDDPHIVNKLFEDERIVSVFSGFKNVDSRGYPSVSLRIIDGLVILEFSWRAGKNPSRRGLVSDISSVDDCLNRLLSVVNKLKGIESPQ